MSLGGFGVGARRGLGLEHRAPDTRLGETPLKLNLRVLEQQVESEVGNPPPHTCTQNCPHI